MGEINVSEERNLCDFSTNIVFTANDDHAASPLNIEWLSTFLLNFIYVLGNGFGNNRRVFNSHLQKFKWQVPWVKAGYFLKEAKATD
jgi:hypothetical protein